MASAPPKRIDVPKPIDYLLPKRIRIHRFTTAGKLTKDDGAVGISVRVEATDHFGDSGKAFGQFRFELYSFRDSNADPKGNRIRVWEVPLMDVKKNLLHWDQIARVYNFKLQCDQAIAPGQPFVLMVVFSSPFTERRIDERKFTGE